MADFTYYITAADALKGRAETAYSNGNIDTARYNFKLAAKKYREAADLSSDQKNILLEKAIYCENMAQSKQAQKPKNTDPKSKYSEQQVIEDKHINRQISNGEYSQYNLDIVASGEKVNFDDIIGLDDAKKLIHQSLIYPLKFPENFNRYGLKPGGNILLEGPPGTGKTTFAKAVANEIDIPFINVNCNQLVDSYIGKTGKNIDSLFDEVRRFIKEQKTPIILFFDEFDSIAKTRKSDDKTAEEAVPSLIKQLDGFNTDNNNITIIAATNLKECLDGAILSRFNNSIYIPLPNPSERKEMFIHSFKKISLGASDIEQINFDLLAERSNGLSGRDIKHIITSFLGILAQRDSGIIKLDKSLTEILCKLTEERKASNSNCKS